MVYSHVVTPSQAIAFLRAHVHGTLHTDSRNICPGDGFIAYPGSHTDGRIYITEAIARGATACLLEYQGVEQFTGQFALNVNSVPPIVTLPHLQAATGIIAAEWFGQPSRCLYVLAVTGTNGKTSTTWWLAEALNALVSTSSFYTLLSQKKRQNVVGCAIIGTLGAGIPPVLQTTGLTTLDAVRMQRMLRTFVDNSVLYVALEASSIGLAQQRLAGTRIQVALFTNFTQDHLDWHGSMAAYWQAKRDLFDWAELGAAVVNIDDACGAVLWAELQKHSSLDLWSISTTNTARLAARNVQQTAQGLAFTVLEGNEAHRLHTHLMGIYNVTNLLGVLATLRAIGIPLAQAVVVCAQLGPIPGRMQQVTPVDGVSEFPLVFVDYAHTPDALGQALLTLQPVARERGGRLWCIFGCGGNRDAGKRPLMGMAAQQGADCIIITSDNPRHENPDTIIKQIVQGITGGVSVSIESDRTKAIAWAVTAASATDVILIAGKGHETWQEIAGQRLPFSDVVHARAALAARRGRT